MDEVGNEGKRILVGNCPFVQVSVVLYRSVLAILFADEKESAGVW